jgi:perosamine synthetase
MFKEFIEKIYNTEELDMLHQQSLDYYNINNNKTNNSNLNDVETDLHKKFYNEIKSNDCFKKLYCSLIQDIYSHFFPDEEALIYQSYPSIRFQFCNSITVPPHCDSDSIGKHPIGEKNFIVPITKMENTNSVYIESFPGKGDFEPVFLEYGDIFYFNGNKCIHKNEPNLEKKMRISFDFRVILLKDYLNYINNDTITFTNPRDRNSDRTPVKMTVGGYYQITYKYETIEQMLEWYKIPELILQHRPTFGIEEAEACYNYMKDDNFITEHKKTIELEKIICSYLNVKNCIMTTSCTSALILALMSLNLNNNDEVIVPNYTMIATVNCVKHLGLTPIIIDVDCETYSMTLEEIKKHITPKTKAVIHVSINNRYKDLEEIYSYCKEKNIILIEDAAQSLGCKKNDKFLGTFGDIGCFSLSTPKIISSGQGGFVVTNHDDLALKISQIKNFGRRESGKDIFETFGINLKYTDLQAVITIEQMKKLDFRIKRMSEIYNLYYENLNKYIKMLEPLFEGWHPWFVDIYCKSNNFREKLMCFLKKHNIQTREAYVEINKTSVYYNNSHLRNSAEVSNSCLFLPSYITLTNEEINYICKIIKIFIIGSQEVLYRDLEKKDYRDYLILINNFRETNINISHDYFNEIYDNVFSKYNKIIVCEFMGKIIGSITIVIEQKFIHNFSKYAHIEDIFVDNHFRHKKIGSELVNKALSYCKNLNVFKVSLNCDESLENFYALNKFEKRQIYMSQLL